MVINWIPPKKLTKTNSDVQPLIEVSGFNILWMTKTIAKIKDAIVIIIPAMEDKYSGFSLNEVRPLNANLMYFINEKVVEPAYLISLL